MTKHKTEALVCVAAMALSAVTAVVTWVNNQPLFTVYFGIVFFTACGYFIAVLKGR